ncbi:MAG: tyrosine-type recombinase/integrase [Sphingomonadales bacterium]|nr:tyrosine-type recombinase/integrase [Sphingomonadales bacterium]
MATDSPKVRITKSVFAEAQAADREYVIWDSRIAGFGLRVRPTGSKSFIFAYRTAGGRAGQYRRVTIKASNPEVALERAKELSGQHHGGIDPAGQRAEEKKELAAARRILSVGDVLDSFVTDHAKERLATKTWTEYERIVDKLLKPAIGAIKIDALEPKDVAGMYHDQRAKPTQAALAVRVLSSAMSWAEENGLRPAGSNPARIRLKGSRRRQRLFTEPEVARLQAAVTTLEREKNLTATVALGLRLLFATGCRAGEICELKWSNLDLAEGIARWPASKTGYLEKPITGEASTLLKKAPRIVGVDWVCPGSDPKKALRVETLEAGFERAMTAASVIAGENASLHLIRHWFATKIYTDKDIPLPVQMAIVGHKSVATAMRYAHVNRADVQKAAATAAKKRVAAVKAAGKRGKVVVLEGRK